MVLVRWKKRGCVSSSRDIDRLNKAFQATKYVQNSGVVYTYLQGVHQDIVRRLEFLFWQPINGLCQRRRPSRPFKVSRLSFPAEYYSGWRLVECRSQTRKLVLSSLRAAGMKQRDCGWTQISIHERGPFYYGLALFHNKHQHWHFHYFSLL